MADGAADLVLVNLQSLPPAGGGPKGELIAVTGRQIAFVGDSAALAGLVGPDTRLVDCRGGLVVPGFNDAHCHPLAHAATLRHIDCSAVTGIAGLQDLLRRRAVAAVGDAWLRASGWDGSPSGAGRLPNRDDLDAAVCDRPLVLIEKSGQRCVLNSQAIDRCGLGGMVDADGMVLANQDEVAARIPPLSLEDIAEGLRLASRQYLSLGVTSLQDTSWSNGLRHLRTWRRFKADGVLVPRLTMLAGFGALADFAEKGLKTGSGGPSLRLGAMKIALDESTGNPQPSREDILRAASAAHRAGFQLAFHVPDLPMLEHALDALEVIAASGPDRCRRPRLEHCPVCPPGLLTRLASAGAVAVTQPNLFSAWGGVHRHPAGWIHPLRSLLAAGVPVAFGSDSPLTASAPFPAMATAVTRRLADGTVLAEEQGITPAEALGLYTAGPAFSSFDEDLKGAIAPGMLADLVVLDRNPLCLPADEMAGTEASLTILDGKIVWERRDPYNRATGE